MHWAKIYKLPALSIRFFNIYGPRARTSGTYGAVFGVFLAQLLAGKPLTIVGDGTQTRDCIQYHCTACHSVFCSSKQIFHTICFTIFAHYHLLKMLRDRTFHCHPCAYISPKALAIGFHKKLLSSAYFLE
jgi:dTDP-D-glucose 4,6-dehydratase